jgi:hypothetical protein
MIWPRDILEDEVGVSVVLVCKGAYLPKVVEHVLCMACSVTGFSPFAAKEWVVPIAVARV